MPFDWVDVVDDGVVLPPLPTEPPHVMPESPGDVSIVVTGWQGGGTPTGTGSWSSGGEPIEFELKDEFEVEGGAIGNGTVTFTYENGGGTSHSCTYQGQSPTEQPTTKLDLALARLLTFVNCTDGQPHDAPRSGTDFTIEVQGIPGYPVTVGSPMTKDGFCSEKLELLTASETAQMRAEFNWNNATLVPEYDADNRPTLYYAWVYLRDEAELASYRKLLIHQLNRPLFEEELDEFSGRCGAITNPGDGEGAFVLSVIPGITYNRLIRARTSDEVEGDREIFDAVILREVPDEVQSTGGSISYEALAEAESPRVSRRLQNLRKWSHGKEKQVLTRGEGASSTTSGGKRTKSSVALGGSGVGGRENRLFRRNAA